jgi:hypothetical protein
VRSAGDIEVSYSPAVSYQATSAYAVFVTVVGVNRGEILTPVAFEEGFKTRCKDKGRQCSPMISLPICGLIFYIFHHRANPDRIEPHALYVVELVGYALESKPLDYRLLRG